MRAREHSPARKRSLRGFLIDRAATPPLRGGEYSSQTQTLIFKLSHYPLPIWSVVIPDECAWQRICRDECRKVDKKGNVSRFAPAHVHILARRATSAHLRNEYAK